MNSSRRSLPALLFGICLLGIAATAADAQYGVTTVADSAFSGNGQTMPAVAFPHDAHNERAEIYDCNTCHHLYEDGQKVADADSVGMECSECHLGADSNRMDLVRAYHLQCRNCHLERKAGPILCGQCHGGPR